MSPPNPNLIVICGPPLAGKSNLAAALAEQVGDKTAVIPYDELLTRWIVVHGTDAEAEREMVLSQVKLMAVNYLKSGYNLIVEGAFADYHGSYVQDHTGEVKGLIGITAQLVRRNVIVVLRASEAALRQRADAGSPDLEAALAIARAYEEWLPGAMRLDTATLSRAQMVEATLRALRRQAS
jgi:broad-specificity NMP kinase